MWEQAPLEAKLVSYNPETFNAILMNRGQSCMQRSGEDGKPSVLSCDLNSDSQLMAHNLQIDLTLSLQMLLRNVEAQAQKISEQMVRGRRYVNSKMVLPRSTKKEPMVRPQFVKNDDVKPDAGTETSAEIGTEAAPSEVDPRMLPTKEPKYSPDMVISKTSASFDSPGWPSKQQCLQWKLYKDNGKNNVMPVFMPPENKGFE